MNAMRFDWRASGTSVEGPGTTGLIVAAIHSADPRHFDIGFVLDRTQPKPRVLWDCSTGFARDPDEAVVKAIDVWSQVTAPAILELMTLRGEFADHFHDDDPFGLPGWHVIGGIVLGWGRGTGPNDLQRWALEHPLLPPLRDSLAPLLPTEGPVGLRVYFGASATGGDTTEIRVDGADVYGPSAALASLAWPRLELAYVKTYFLLVHPETGNPTPGPSHA